MSSTSNDSVQNEAAMDEASYREFIKLLNAVYVSDTVQDLPFSTDNAYYSGFDVITFVKTMVAKARKLGKKPKEIRKDFVGMAFLGALRENNIDTIRNKSQPEIVTFVNNMVSAYGLSRNPIDKNGATLSRFAIACSPDVCRLYKQHEIKPVIDLPSEIGFPNFMCFSTFGSLIPTRTPGTELVKLAFLYHQIRLDKTLNSHKKDYRLDFDKVKNFIEVVT